MIKKILKRETQKEKTDLNFCFVFGFHILRLASRCSIGGCYHKQGNEIAENESGIYIMRMRVGIGRGLQER